ncbi:sulfurtransferase [Aureispira anguillae]|uniref:Sulfurtransferase n=1 Tax=Aureispira anguillae TaxID=2864201 RepID=A0A916DTQ0_9BACT|nr:sulfurtransferase [Aureispira anguillae]BDS11982.1 sulfurtransferase [Aureispira anguillae]
MKDSLVSVAWLKEHWADPNLVILDASLHNNKSNLTSSYPDLQIKGARFFDLKKVFSNQASSLPNMLPSPIDFSTKCCELGIHQSSKIVVYDNLGIYSSPRVWWMFKAMGHANVAVLDGGLPAWVQEESAVEKRRKRFYSKGDFSANYQATLICNAEDILKNIDQAQALVIDARSAERFKGLVPEPRKELAKGHIPKSINLPFQKVIQNGKLKSKKELRELIAPLIPNSSPVICSCGSGTTACILLLAFAQIITTPTALYDGSWSEWGSLKNAPIES